MEYTRLLKKNSRGDDVKAVQTALHCYPDGIYGDLTTEAVREFQKANNLEVDGIVGRQTWNALFPASTNASGSNTLKKSKRSINLIVVHCTATEEGKDYSVAEIRRWHLKRGFSDIGYHYLIGIDGKVHEGRNVNISGAHTAGYNAHSIGVCYVGGLDKNHKAKDTPQHKKHRFCACSLTSKRYTQRQQYMGIVNMRIRLAHALMPKMSIRAYETAMRQRWHNCRVQ